MTALALFWIAAGLAVLLVLLVLGSVRIVPQGARFTLERFGRYRRTLSPGVRLKWPLIERVGARLSVQEQILRLEAEALHTRDNVRLEVTAVAFYQVVHAAHAAYEVADLPGALRESLAADLRAVFGALTLDAALSQRSEISDRLLAAVDRVAEPWGVRVTRAEVTDVVPPESVATAAAKAAEAERLRRAAVAAAEGERQAEIARAETEQQAAILRAEGHKQQAVREAEARERAAEAEARATLMLSQAIRQGDGEALRYLLARQYVDALRAAATAENVRVLMLPLDPRLASGDLGGVEAAVRASVADEVGAEVPGSDEALRRAFGGRDDGDDDGASPDREPFGSGGAAAGPGAAGP